MVIVRLNQPYQIHIQIKLKLNCIPFHCQFELLSLKHLSSLLSSIKSRFNLVQNLEWRTNWIKCTHTYKYITLWIEGIYSFSLYQVQTFTSLVAPTSEIFFCDNINNVANLHVIVQLLYILIEQDWSNSFFMESIIRLMCLIY